MSPSLYIVWPRTKAARQWWDENVSNAMMLGDGYCVEHRYIDAIVAGMEGYGLEQGLDFKVSF